MTHRQVGDGVWVVTAGSFPSNSYICAADVPGGAVLIDAGLDPAPIDAALQTLGLTPAYVFCTHGHFDHIGSAAYFQAKYGSPVTLHEADAKTASMCNFLLKAMGMDDRVERADLTLVPTGYVFKSGDFQAGYRHTPGHTPGSCMIEIGSHLFSGDTLYARGLGLSKLPGEQPSRLRDSIDALWDELGDYLVHPGHGPSASGRDIKESNDALIAFVGREAAVERHGLHG